MMADLVQRPAADAQRRYIAMLGELAEAKQMAGAGPWAVGPQTMKATEAILADAAKSFNLRESLDGAIGASGDINLMLANVEWRREISLSWLEFSRGGIQQIILRCRLYYIKNPIPRRLIDVCAAYVFARGVEVTTSDEKANEVLKDFFERNAKVFGQCALTESEKRKDYDGNLYWCFFADKANKGLCDARLIDATEIQEIVCNPEDSDEPWYYKRIWTQQNWTPEDGISNVTEIRWYPALRYDPPVKPDAIQGYAVDWNARVKHRKCGAVGKWQFGCPRVYPMIDWAREARSLLEACASIKQSLMQIGLVLTTKGGQQAMMGAKEQIGTTVGPNTNLWDTNPPAGRGSTFVSGPGTELKAFDSSKGGGNPDDVRQYKLMCCMVKGVPETFLADVSTGNLATATSLDRPTETMFLSLQEEWREDLTDIAKYVLDVSAGAPSGVLRESAGHIRLEIRECPRRRGPRGEVIYEAMKPKAGVVEIQVNFPAIREGDQAAQVKSIVSALTLDNKAGQIIGIDEKTGVKALYNALDIEGGEELAEEQYPEGKYTADRTEEILNAPIQKPKPPAGGQPQIDPETGEPTNVAPDQAPELQEALPSGRVTRRWNPR